MKTVLDVLHIALLTVIAVMWVAGFMAYRQGRPASWRAFFLLMLAYSLATITDSLGR